MNIRELAALCKLSISSVSRAMNNPPGAAQMSRKTYERVHAMAKELGYRPNYHARAFLKKSSGCIGFIAGSPLNHIGASLLEGLSDVLEERDMTISLYSTRNEIGREIKAFDRMFYRNVDAIVYLSIIQQGEYRGGHLTKLLEDNPGHPPVLSLLSGGVVQGMFQLRMKDAEAGRNAALRQLRLGSRKFGIVTTLYSAPAAEAAAGAYRDTLQENGVPPQDISEVRIWHFFPEEKREVLRDVDGLWISYYLLLPECHHALSRVCELEKLHIDTVSTLENEALLLWLQIDRSGSCRVADHFASLNVFQYNSRLIGRLAGDMIVKMIGEPGLKPYTDELDWNWFDRR